MAGPVSKEKIEAIMAKEPIPEVKNAMYHHTAYRIKDPEVSLDFYRRIFGMSLQVRYDLQQYKTTAYFIGYGDPENNPSNDIANWKDVSVELFHIWGSETQPDLKFANGNDHPKGFGHIAIAVPDVYAFAKRVEALGVKFIKKPEEGTPRGQAFLQDPDGYYIEVLSEIAPAPGQPNPKLYDDMFKLQNCK